MLCTSNTQHNYTDQKVYIMLKIMLKFLASEHAQ